MAKLRILLADDSSFARGLLRSLLEEEGDIDVVGEAGNGREAINLVRQLNPDLVTMDLEMPLMGGLETIEELMATQALPILVVSSVANAQNAYEAILRGALDVVSKPAYQSAEATEFVAKVRMLAGVRVITHMRPQGVTARSGASTVTRSSVAVNEHSSPTHHESGSTFQRIFTIASSTGGPQVLARILARLPAEFPCPVLIAQHISDGFAGGMVEWLGKLCKLPVRIASEGELIQPATVYVAPSERHLAVTSARRFTLIERDPQDIYRPSCDTLLAAVAAVFSRQVVGIILTGMGGDGAQGLARVLAQGGLTLAQNETSSVVFGMNRVAIEAGAVQQVLSIDAIADAMLRLAEPNSRVAGQVGR